MAEITLEQIYAGIKRLGDNVLRDMAKDNQTKIVDLNKKQLLRGEKSIGTQIGKYKEPTVVARRKKGLQTDFIDLKFEGHFQNEMLLEVRGLEYEIFSRNWKNDMLVGRYTFIFGLQQKSLEEFYPTSQEYLVKKVNQFTGWEYA